MREVLYRRPVCSIGITMSSFNENGRSSAGSDSLGHFAGGPSLGRALTQEELERVARSREQALAKRAEAKRKQGASAVGTDRGAGWVSVKKPAADAGEAVLPALTCSKRLVSSQKVDRPAFVKQERYALEEDYTAAAAESNRAHQSAEDERKPATSSIKKAGGPKKVEEFLFVLGSDNKNMAVSHLGAFDSQAEDAPRRPAAPVQALGIDAQLSEQQMKVLKAVGEGKSVFLTGSAGTGKSFLLAYAIRLLRTMHGTDAVHVTASTGIAACAIGGSTVHSFAGIGLGEGSAEVLLAKVKGRRELRRRWETAKALVIDEISMIDATLMDKLDFIGRNTRHFCRHKPFGGIQLLVTGDFFQLPPVTKKKELSFAFEAECWAKCFDLQVELTKVFRQAGSQTFVDILNEVRRGVLSDRAAELLSQRVNATVEGCSQDGIIATKLYPYRMDVAKENHQRLMELAGEEFTYTAVDRADDDFAAQLLEHTRAEKRLVLKRGAQVMLLKNLSTSLSLVNGSRGIVVDFVDYPTPQQQTEQDEGAKGGTRKTVQYWPLVQFAEGGEPRVMGPEMWKVEKHGHEIASRTQVPLTLAWALSVHKCQGMTLDRVDTNLSRAFDYGMVYVALSRVRKLEGLHLSGFDPKKIRVHGKVVAFYDDLQRPGSAKLDSIAFEKEDEGEEDWH